MTIAIEELAKQTYEKLKQLKPTESRVAVIQSALRAHEAAIIADVLDRTKKRVTCTDPDNWVPTRCRLCRAYLDYRKHEADCIVSELERMVQEAEAHGDAEAGK